MNKALERIDKLIAQLEKDGQITVWSGDREVEWQLKIRWERLYAFYRRKGRVTWRSLNPGWMTARPVAYGRDRARILLGQIFVGERDDGDRLEKLTCGREIAD